MKGTESSERLCDGFLRSVSMWPARPALEIGDRTLSYQELAASSARVASTLLGAGLEPGEPVALLAHRTLASYVACLGILRAGGCYVPTNHRFPERRNVEIALRSRARLAVVEPEQLDAFGGVLEQTKGLLKTLVVANGGDAAVLASRYPEYSVVAASDGTDDCAPVPFASEHLAYVMFTSGTTGRPKGVGISHANASTYLANLRSRFDFFEEDRFSQMFDLTFDLSVHDLFLCWSVGACLCVVPDNQVMLPAKFIRDRKLSAWFSVPSAASMLNRLKLLRPAAFPSLRYSAFCGEALPTVLADAWQAAAPTSVVENLYGPTEATIAFTGFRMKGALEGMDLVPIGTPFDGQAAIVVNSDLEPVADGEVGELCLGGSQLAGGYLDDPEQTSARFVEIDVGADLPRRWYRTGDLARKDANVGLIFLGRTDTQVKILGYRVELGEIEAVVRQIARTDFVVALAWPKTAEGARGVVAFLTEHAAPIDRVLELSARELPPYMVPSRIVKLDRFPLNANGKIDRGALEEHLRGENERC
jgi:D-alanine--poly(phosphoribitol) ligase subunit 1